MSFFVKAVVMSLEEYPAVNAEIREDNIIYKNQQLFISIFLIINYQNNLLWES